MTNKQLDNRVKKLQSIEAQMKELEEQADAIRAEIKAGKCRSEADVEALAARLGDEVFWPGSLPDDETPDAAARGRGRRMSAEQYDGLTDDELRQLARETVDRLDDQGRAELLEWVKKEFGGKYGYN